MFERFTEKARRVVFFARYEASQFGCTQIETEHFLLGILREDSFLVHRFRLSPAQIRSEIEQRATIRKQVSTSVDLPLSNESKRVLTYATEEADRLGSKHLGSEHFLLGLLREERGLAAELLREAGLTLANARAQVSEWPSSGAEISGTSANLAHGPTMEVTENGEVLANTMFMVALPRRGDELILRSKHGAQIYTVEVVRFFLDPVAPDLHTLDKVEVVVSKKPG